MLFILTVVICIANRYIFAYDRRDSLPAINTDYCHSISWEGNLKKIAGQFMISP